MIAGIPKLVRYAVTNIAASALLAKYGMVIGLKA